jgi:hypothetical protein
MTQVFSVLEHRKTDRGCGSIYFEVFCYVASHVIVGTASTLQLERWKYALVSKCE